jgi:hypothetical protein
MSLCLTAEELIELTGRRRATAQARQLDHMGIPYRRRCDHNRTLAVLRIHVEVVAGHPSGGRLPPPPEPELRLDKLHRRDKAA